MCEQRNLRPGQFSLTFCLALMTIFSCLLGYVQLAGVKGLMLALFPPLLIGGLVHSAVSSPAKYQVLEDGRRQYDHSKSPNAGLVSLIVGYSIWIPILIVWSLATWK